MALTKSQKSLKNESLGFWTLPKPDIELKQWSRIPRVARTTPFGYKVDETDDDFLIPIDLELELLEKAKQHLQQYSYREVSNWLSKESGRYISHVGLKKRIQVERKRKKAATIKRKLASRLEKTLQEIKKLEQETTGSSTEGVRA
tara:strand:+ start:770 stop:1204 length:435 start_codon:yes stop_codon:yes gene_type:complete